MASSAEQNVGAVISLIAPKKGDNVWKAEQVDIARNLPPGDIAGRIEINWSYGPIKITGYIDTDTYELAISISIVGINVGNIYGNIKDGIGLDINLFVAKGSIKFYLKNGNELWVHLDVSVTFDGSFSGDHKIISCYPDFNYDKEHISNTS
ncbi:hypothetical protein CDV36_011920 [Fusarium kuroshium]|uniref:Uncharacterized protein n=1 Tax=Fusarium kuroshium TaxID=2010991 RepID=A0A3M2RUC5_9HYPO|nr:hypothetical protein CDV36_011920 [Fusarium kuroshium]